MAVYYQQLEEASKRTTGRTGLTRFRVVDQSDPHLAEALDICPTGQSRTTPGRSPTTPTHKPPGADA